MEESRQAGPAQEEIGLGESLAAVRAHWWQIAGLSLAVGLVTFGYMYTKPNLYTASATITPSIEESKQNPALGAIASLGFQVGGPSKVEDLEILFKSNDLTVRVFSKHDLWAIALGDRFDARTGTVRPTWSDRILGRTEAKPPGKWDAVRAAKRGLAVAVNRRAGSISLSFQSPSPQGSADIVKYYLDEAKNRLQEEALARANQNKQFIGEQIGRTVDVLARERLYSMLGQEVEKEMLARNREQFGFRIIDAPMAPDRKTSPKRGATAAVACFLSACVLAIVFLTGNPRRKGV